jgi:hypothetical protein
LALVKNSDLLDIAHLGRSAMPIDLMTYAPSDEQPSMFLLKEDKRQSILTVFNWTDGERKRAITLSSLGLKEQGKYTITEVFGEQNCCSNSSGSINLVQPPHSVRMFKLIDNAVPAVPPAFETHAGASAKAGESLTFSAAQSSPDAPVLACHWDFGDGTTLDGMELQHAYTQRGEYEVHVTVTGLGAITNSTTIKVSVSGKIPSTFNPSARTRLE